MVMLAHKYYTSQEYLALEEKADYKSEYRDGEIFQMAGGTPNHGFIINNVGTALNNALGDLPCQASGSELKVYVAAHNMYIYPDGLVVCGDPIYKKIKFVPQKEPRKFKSV